MAISLPPPLPRSHSLAIDERVTSTVDLGLERLRTNHTEPLLNLSELPETLPAHSLLTRPRTLLLHPLAPRVLRPNVVGERLRISPAREEAIGVPFDVCDGHTGCAPNPGLARQSSFAPVPQPLPTMLRRVLLEPLG